MLSRTARKQSQRAIYIGREDRNASNRSDNAASRPASSRIASRFQNSVSDASTSRLSAALTARSKSSNTSFGDREVPVGTIVRKGTSVPPGTSVTLTSAARRDLAE